MSTTKTKIPLNNINMLSKEDFDNVNFEEHPNELFYTLDETDVTYSDVDVQLSDISENPVQNKVITKALNDKVSNEDISLDANTFAESERQKSKNLWAYGDVSGTKYKDIILEQPLPIGTYTMSYVAESADTDSSKCLIEFYDENGKYISGNNVERHKRENILKKFTVPVGRISFYASTSFAGGKNDTFTFSNIQIEEGEVATDYQPYNGAIIHEKQLKEAVEKRELWYDVLNNRIDITNSTLTTLQQYFDLFKSDTNKIYTCNIGALETSKFKDLLPNVGLGNYCCCYIKHYSNGLWENGRLEAFEIVAFEQFGQGFAKGYLYKNLNNTIVFTGWTKVGG